MATSPTLSVFFLPSFSRSLVTLGGFDGLSGRVNLGDELRDSTGGADGRVDVDGGGTSGGLSAGSSFFAGGFTTLGGRVTRAENLATSTEDTDEAGDVGEATSFDETVGVGVRAVSLSAIGLNILKLKN